jgi:hypothetical protein
VALQLFRIARGKHAARDRDLGKGLGSRIETEMKCRIGARRLAQQFQIGRDTRGRGGGGHRLKIDRDLDANDVEADGCARRLFRPQLRRQNIRRRIVRMPRVGGYDGHARCYIPAKKLPFKRKSLPLSLP